MKLKNIGPDVHVGSPPHLGGPLVKSGEEHEVAGEVVKPATKKQLADAGVEEAPPGMQYLPDGAGVVLVPADATYVVDADGEVRAYATAHWELVLQKKPDSDTKGA